MDLSTCRYQRGAGRGRRSGTACRSPGRPEGGGGIAGCFCSAHSWTTAGWGGVGEGSGGTAQTQGALGEKRGQPSTRTSRHKEEDDRGSWWSHGRVMVVSCWSHGVLMKFLWWSQEGLIVFWWWSQFGLMVGRMKVSWYSHDGFMVVS